jgi:hypothetical protein
MYFPPLKQSPYRTANQEKQHTPFNGTRCSIKQGETLPQTLHQPHHLTITSAQHSTAQHDTSW